MHRIQAEKFRISAKSRCCDSAILQAGQERQLYDSVLGRRQLLVRDVLSRLAIACCSILCAVSVLSAGEVTGEGGIHYVRTYSATANITIWSVTVFSRAGVGGGFAALDQSGDRSTTRLRFLSGSTPSRAHGLNRQGFIDEQQQSAPDGFSSVRYFGFITNNNERSLAEAKSALEKAAGKSIPYTAAKGISNGPMMQFRIATLELPSTFGWSAPSELIRKASEEFEQQSSGKHIELKLPKGQVPQTFLRAVVAAIQSPEPKLTQAYAYNGSVYELQISKQADAQIGRELARAGLVSNAADVWRMKGKIRSANGGSPEEFQLWFDRTSANPLPLRFEYRPRSYLKLVFNAEKAPKSASLANTADEVPDTALTSPAGFR